MLSRVPLFANPWTKPARLPCPWKFPGKITGVGCHVLLQGIFPAQGSNPGLLHLLHWQVHYVPLRRLGKLYFSHQRTDTGNLKLWSPGSPDRPWAGLLYRGGGGESGRGSAQPRCFRLQIAVPGAASLHTARCCHLELSVVCSTSAHGPLSWGVAAAILH